MSDWINVARVEDLPEGAWDVLEIDGARIAVFNLGGEFYAIEDVCTHDSGQLTGGSIEGDEIICPRHGARFCIRTGEVTAPPAYQAITTFPVRIENGMIQVRDHRWD